MNIQDQNEINEFILGYSMSIRKVYEEMNNLVSDKISFLVKGENGKYDVVSGDYPEHELLRGLIKSHVKTMLNNEGFEMLCSCTNIKEGNEVKLVFENHLTQNKEEFTFTISEPKSIQPKRVSDDNYMKQSMCLN
jgi:hypothetical protein